MVSQSPRRVAERHVKGSDRAIAGDRRADQPQRSLQMRGLQGKQAEKMQTVGLLWLIDQNPPIESRRFRQAAGLVVTKGGCKVVPQV